MDGDSNRDHRHQADHYHAMLPVNPWRQHCKSHHQPWSRKKNGGQRKRVGRHVHDRPQKHRHHRRCNHQRLNRKLKPTFGIANWRLKPNRIGDESVEGTGVHCRPSPDRECEQRPETTIRKKRREIDQKTPVGLASSPNFERYTDGFLLGARCPQQILNTLGSNEIGQPINGRRDH